MSYTRRGTVAPFLIISMSVFLAAFALAVNKGWLWTVREELKSAADAAALAAMQSFIDDDLLRGDTNRFAHLTTPARQSARQLAQNNTARGQPLQLLDNPENDPKGDIIFGTVTTPRAGDFTAVSSLDSHNQSFINAVVVNARLTRQRGTAPGLIFGVLAGHSNVDVQATSSAVFDRGVRGFHPLYGNVPLAPIAFLSDKTGSDVRSWENQVVLKNGPDLNRFDKSLKTFIADPAGDEIHEFTAAYATKDAQLAVTNSVIVYLGTTDFNRIAIQLRAGLTNEDFDNFGRKLVLHETDGLNVGGQQFGPDSAQPEFQVLVDALTELKNHAAVRVWPIYSKFALGQAHLTGFVAARVISVVPPTPDTPLTFSLQATVTSRPDAITDTDIRGKQATMNGNLYVGKIRRVD